MNMLENTMNALELLMKNHGEAKALVDPFTTDNTVTMERVDELLADDGDK